MTRTEDWNPLETAPRWIIAVTGAYLCLGAFALYVWAHASSGFSVRAAPGGGEALSVIGMAAAQAWFCVLALRAFEAGAPLRRASRRRSGERPQRARRRLSKSQCHRPRGG